MRTQSSLSGVEIAATIESFDEAEWNRCFPGELEDWAYYRATEQAGVEGFQFRYYGLRDEGRLIAAVPGFVTEYRLETTVQGSLKTVLAGLSRMLPRLMILRMASLGSPVAETCHLGFAPEVPLDHRPEVTARLIDAFEHDAALNRRS
ncbi:MAG TPA: hypothetical protein VL974_06230, partial [Magnetospirillum sp.]|nr:hypothetical protein [Magnetospirillum sp.]